MKCLLDLDGVLADFHSHWYKVNPQFKRPVPWPNGVWSLAQIHGCTWEESCQNLDLDFWMTIPWMPDGKRVLTLLESKFGKDNICLLTSNHVQNAAVAAQGKVKWIEENLPDYNHRYFLGAAKGFLAHNGICLIDDKNENVDDFIQAGGEAFLLPRPWNRKFNIAELATTQLALYLREL